MEEIHRLAKKAVEKGGVNQQEAERLYEIGLENPFLVMAEASRIREHFRGKKVGLCMIVNAKSGLCPEDCKFCAQSLYSTTELDPYPLLSVDDIVERARRAVAVSVSNFGIVTSGPSIETQNEWETIIQAVKRIRDMGLNVCASLGFLDETRAKELKRVGLFRYHHNLETSRTFFPRICTTHTFDDKLKTIGNAKAVGLSVCSGGIIGMGETMKERIELALILRELDVDSVPINILDPRPGTAFATRPPLRPMEILLTIALFRFLLPSKDIRLCGGKEVHLRQLMPLAIVAGCSSLMTGDYLTTQGRKPDLDKEMIEDLDLTWRQ